MDRIDVIIIGGGAAGFFGAINIAHLNPKLRIVILERGKDVLTKVKVSGGGRCNVTHAEFDPSELVSYYPRGNKELLGPFHTFMTGDTIAWFEERGVELKIEDDGRMFPISDSSQTIIDCFKSEVEKYNIDLKTGHAVVSISKVDTLWRVETKQGDFYAKAILMASGSSPKMWKMLEELGHTIVDPVPSLFTFNIIDERITGLAGVVAKDVTVEVIGTTLSSSGPLLITHSGFSAPAILKLSAFGAIELSKLNYEFDLKVNFINMSNIDALAALRDLKSQFSKKLVVNTVSFGLPKRLWRSLVLGTGIDPEKRWADVNKQDLMIISSQLTEAIFHVTGKSTFKEEFVTAGGIDLKEIDFKTFESKLHENLFFAGEVLNIDAVTGGFNFQNAWTGAYIAAQKMSKL